MIKTLAVSSLAAVAIITISLAFIPTEFEFLSEDTAMWGHLFGTASLATLIGWWIKKFSWLTVVTYPILASILAFFIWGMIEVAQIFVPSHSAQLVDVASNFVGAGMGYITLSIPNYPESIGGRKID